MKNLDVFLGNLTEKDREVFDNVAQAGAVLQRMPVPLPAKNEASVGEPHDYRNAIVE